MADKHPTAIHGSPVFNSRAEGYAKSTNRQRHTARGNDRDFQQSLGNRRDARDPENPAVTM
jgi:hypothetical protein